GNALRITCEGAQMTFVGVRIARIYDDDEARGGEARDDYVIDDASGFIQQEGVFGSADGNCRRIKRASIHKQVSSAVARYLDERHVRNVEQSRMRACVLMFFHDAQRVTDRH